MSTLRPLLSIAAEGGHRARMALAAVLGAIAVLAAVGLLTTSGYLISRAAQQPEILMLALAIVGVRFFGLVRALARYAERLVSHDVALREIGRLRRRFFAALVPLVPSGLGGHRRGELLSRFVSDVDRLQDVWLRALLPPMIAVLAGAGALIVALLLYPPAALVLAISLVLGGVVVPWISQRAARAAGRNQAAARAELSADLVEISAGAGELALAGREADWIVKMRASGARLASIQRRDALAAGLGGGLQLTLLAATAVAMTAVALPAVSDGALAGVLLAAVALLGIAAQEAVAPLPAAAASIDACSVAATRVDEVVASKPAISEPEVPSPVPAAGPIELRDVSFSYPDGTAVLDRISLTLRAGEAVSLGGPSGGGKTTLAELLVRFNAPTGGGISIGGTPYERLDSDELRTVVMLAGQDAYAFAVSLRENLMLGDPAADDARLEWALSRVGLGAWLEGLPDGLDTQLGELGATVSGGQRQRLGVARALLTPASFLIFDEPTAHLDPASGEALLEVLAEEARRNSRGVLVISHEQAAGAGFDHRLWLEDGRLSRR